MKNTILKYKFKIDQFLKKDLCMIYFISSQFKNPKTGGEKYNFIVSEYLKKRDKVELIDYPWSLSFINKFLFDVK